jgi:hypothetical protein
LLRRSHTPGFLSRFLFQPGLTKGPGFPTLSDSLSGEISRALPPHWTRTANNGKVCL